MGSYKCIFFSTYIFIIVVVVGPVEMWIKRVLLKKCPLVGASALMIAIYGDSSKDSTLSGCEKPVDKFGRCQKKK